jgi:hypothetical protein
MGCSPQPKSLPPPVWALISGTLVLALFRITSAPLLWPRHFHLRAADINGQDFQATRLSLDARQ